MGRASEDTQVKKEDGGKEGMSPITGSDTPSSKTGTGAVSASDFQTHEEQQRAIEQCLAWRNGARDISLKNWKRYRRQCKTKQRAA